MDFRFNQTLHTYTDQASKKDQVDTNLKALENNCSRLLQLIKENSEEIEKLKNEKKYSTKEFIESKNVN